MVSDERLKELLSYIPASGYLYWRASGYRRERGSIAGVARNGSIYVTIDGTEYMGARIAWKLHYGEWPTGRVPGKNKDNTELRIHNHPVCNGAWKTADYKNADGPVSV